MGQRERTIVVAAAVSMATLGAVLTALWAAGNEVGDALAVDAGGVSTSVEIEADRNGGLPDGAVAPGLADGERDAVGGIEAGTRPGSIDTGGPVGGDGSPADTAAPVVTDPEVEASSRAGEPGHEQGASPAGPGGSEPAPSPLGPDNSGSPDLTGFPPPLPGPEPTSGSTTPPPVGTTQAPPGSTTTAPPVDPVAVEWEIHRLTNELRSDPAGELARQAPLPACIEDPTYRISIDGDTGQPAAAGSLRLVGPVSIEVSRTWSEEMDRTGLFEHRPRAELRALLADLGHEARLVTENIAWAQGYGSADMARVLFEGWRESDGTQYCALISPRFSHVGVGFHQGPDIAWATQNLFLPAAG